MCTARVELVRDGDEVDQLFAVMAARNPMLRRFVPIPSGPDGHLDPDALAAATDHGFCIVRWQVES
jgi:hypothetical protein